MMLFISHGSGKDFVFLRESRYSYVIPVIKNSEFAFCLFRSFGIFLQNYFFICKNNNRLISIS